MDKTERVVFETIFFAACLVVSFFFTRQLLLIIVILILIYILLKNVYLEIKENNRLLKQLLEREDKKDISN